MANFAVIVKPAGGATGRDRTVVAGNTSVMTQAKAKSYLQNILNEATRNSPGGRTTNLGQCLNDVFSTTEGKSNGDLKYNGFNTRHASHGVVGVSSVTLFFYVNAGTAYIFAMGEHKGSDSYTICYFGPAEGSFKRGGVVQLGS